VCRERSIFPNPTIGSRAPENVFEWDGGSEAKQVKKRRSSEPPIFVGKNYETPDFIGRNWL
jgi:hypothetical protein